MDGTRGLRATVRGTCPRTPAAADLRRVARSPRAAGSRGSGSAFLGTHAPACENACVPRHAVVISVEEAVVAGDALALALALLGGGPGARNSRRGADLPDRQRPPWSLRNRRSAGASSPIQSNSIQFNSIQSNSIQSNPIQSNAIRWGRGATESSAAATEDNFCTQVAARVSRVSPKRSSWARGAGPRACLLCLLACLLACCSRGGFWERSQERPACLCARREPQQRPKAVSRATEATRHRDGPETLQRTPRTHALTHPSLRLSAKE